MRIHQRQGDLYPDDDETYEDFMDRCTDEIGDEDVCQLIWDDRGAKDVCHKTHASKVAGLEFVLSDETPDRMGDVIMADGWELTNFQKNPIALFGHNSSFPIGKWKNLRVVDKQLRGFLEMAPAGTSERVDEIRKLIDADILRAVSVGFRPKASRPRPESDYGVFFTKAELLETSLVSVPANPNALAVAKSLNISPATIDLVFAGKGNGNRSRRRGSTGGHADTSMLLRKGAAMSSFAQRITAAEQRLNGLRDQLNEHWTKTDETNVSDEQLKTANELTEKITQEERTLTALRDSERILATTSDDGRDATTGRALVPARTAQSSIVLGHGTAPARPFSAPAPKKLSRHRSPGARRHHPAARASGSRAVPAEDAGNLRRRRSAPARCSSGRCAPPPRRRRRRRPAGPPSSRRRCSPPSWKCFIRRRCIRGWRPWACR